MNSRFKQRLLVEVLIGMIFTTPVTLAATLTLPTTPLITGSSVAPNLMLLLDSSGSMSNIVPDSPYDSTTASYTCTNGLSTGSQINISISSTGVVSFNGYLFGNGSGEACFTDSATYNARLYANSGSFPLSPSNYLSASYSGRYLNWYFDSTTGGFADGKKEDTYTRMEITKSAAVDLVEQLSDIRVGLAKYNGSDGAKILTNIGALDAAHSSDLSTQIEAISNDGMTPLGESLADMGRYFTLGYPASYSLVVDPDGSAQSVATSSVFTNSLAYRSGLSAPSQVTQYWCQDNFVVAMTDGVPTNDSSVSSYLKSYYNGSGEILDDVALALFDMDLRPDLSNGSTEVKNNVITHIVGFADESVVNSTLMENAASNGGGTFIGAQDSASLVSAFKSASQNIFAQVAAASAVSFNISEINTDRALFLSSFNTSGWQGTLEAYLLSDTGTQLWNTGDKLNALSNTADDGDDIYDRNIFTYNNTTKQGVEFALANLSAAQKNDLYAGIDADGDGTSVDDAGLLINYLFGDNSNEGSDTTNYRTRASRLGDIVNSTTVYVGAPELSWPDYSVNDKFGSAASSYSAFKVSAADRTPMIYVGANDAMLHGFNAQLSGTDAGKEVMAYIPGVIASSATDAGLHYLADPDYAHQFYVDLTPKVSDVYIGVDSAEDAWHSVLIGGLRAGGTGLFALDITDPTKFISSTENAQDLVLWEFGNTDDADFGYSYSEPTVAMMANGKWAVIVGNGYNSNNTKAALFILFIEEGTDGVWTVNTDYIKIAIDSPTSNGLSTPTVVDSDGDSVADRVYAGDLQGNMWAFDVSSTTATDWAVAHQQYSNAKPLFTALDSDGTPQPITSAPIVTNNSTSSNASPNFLVFFGTGKYLEATDIASNQQVMSYYSILDAGVGEKLRENLTVRTLLTSGDLRTITGSNWSGSSGWYFDLVDRENIEDTAFEYGERVVSDSTLSGEVLFFNSIIPDGDACSSGGQSWFMSLDLDTGLAPSYAVFDADGDGIIEDFSAEQGGDLGYIGEKYQSALVSNSSILESTQYTVDSNGTLVERDVYIGGNSRVGRISWEEMIRD